DVHRRVILHELFDVRRKVMKADAVDRRDADRAGNDVLDFLQPAVQGVVGLNDLFAEIVQDLALARETELLLAALNQQRLELALQRTDLLAHGGLRDVVDLRSFGEALGFRQVAEDFQALYLHKQSAYANQASMSTNVRSLLGRIRMYG